MVRPMAIQVWCKEHEIDLWADDFLRRDISRPGFIYEIQGLMCEGDCREHWEIKEVQPVDAAACGPVPVS
jgi:hypothetical protein